ncbi:MAG: GDP-mannose 4,6-dehydratase [Proteobacteria bacterium]|nr:GDP-mannose 4,6-dehydratase [Pseudomonadota bacterium]
MSNKSALITGINGQDGSYLAEFLLKRGYEIHGVIRGGSTHNTENINHLLEDDKKINLYYCDITDSPSIFSIVSSIKPNEIYNLASQSHVHLSFSNAEYTANVNALGTLRILEAIRSLDLKCKFYQASTSELFGKTDGSPQNEETPFYPKSPYGISKLYAHWITKNYRESYNLFACSGILFNHESPRRGNLFVTKKIAKGLSDISKGNLDVLRLGNLNVKKDWGHAKDFVEAMWLILQQDEPEDYVIATGVQKSIREFVEECAPYFDISIEWTGEGLDEVGINKNTGKEIIKVDPKYFRPSDIDCVLGDPSKAKNKLGWCSKISFKELVEDMCINEK